jgi:hypothetical protein
VAQPINLNPLDFKAQTKKPSQWFWGPNHQTEAASFERKLQKTVATSFEAKLKKTVATGFEAKPEKTIAAGFEAKPLEIVAAGFEAKPPETVTIAFEAKSVNTIRVILRPNHSQTVIIGLETQTDKKPSQWFCGQTIDLDFEAQPRNPWSSSPCAWCRMCTTPPDLSIARPPGTRLMRPSPILCTRSPTPAMILVVAHHTAPAHQETSKRDSPNEIKIKEK